MTDFEATWANLQNRLRPGTDMPGWSRDKGQTPLTFKIVDVTRGSISISPEEGSKRVISKSEFAKVYVYWPDYCSGDVTRAEMNQRSHNTSYIFSILHAAGGDSYSG
jgi:hypothetical protein